MFTMSTKPKTIGRTTKRVRDTRPSSAKRGYGRDYRKFRRDYLAANPLCNDCEHTLAEEVHHINKVKDRPDLRLVAENVVGLCKRCHSKRTVRGE